MKNSLAVLILERSCRGVHFGLAVESAMRCFLASTATFCHGVVQLQLLHANNPSPVYRLNGGICNDCVCQRNMRAVGLAFGLRPAVKKRLLRIALANGDLSQKKLIGVFNFWENPPVQLKLSDGSYFHHPWLLPLGVPHLAGAAARSYALWSTTRILEPGQIWSGPAIRSR